MLSDVTNAPTSTGARNDRRQEPPAFVFLHRSHSVIFAGIVTLTIIIISAVTHIEITFISITIVTTCVSIIIATASY